MVGASDMTAAEFAAALEGLRRGYGPAGGTGDPPGNYRSDGCERCASCMFCVGCRDCYRCTHCTRCVSTTGSSHCVDCTSCHACSHCERSESCAGSAYLVRCYACFDCTYCFGCVGLVKKEFHVLNQPYGRTEYFALVKSLRAALFA
jgi:hypothetical protein